LRVIGRKINRIHWGESGVGSPELGSGTDYFQGPQAFQLAGNDLPALREDKTGFKKIAIAASVSAYGARVYEILPREY